MSCRNSTANCTPAVRRPRKWSRKVRGSFGAVGLYDLLQALQQLLKERPEPLMHEVTAEQLSVSDRINQILAALQGQQSMAFTELFAGQASRHELIVSFLAMLELVKLRLVRLLQSQCFGAIWLTPAVEEAATAGTVHG